MFLVIKDVCEGFPPHQMGVLQFTQSDTVDLEIVSGLQVRAQPHRKPIPTTHTHTHTHAHTHTI